MDTQVLCISQWTIQLAYFAEAVLAQFLVEASLVAAFFCMFWSHCCAHSSVAVSILAGHDLNAFGNGGPLAPLSVPRSYEIPGDFLGTHKFPRVQVFSVGIKPPTVAANVVQSSNAEQVGHRSSKG